MTTDIGPFTVITNRMVAPDITGNDNRHLTIVSCDGELWDAVVTFSAAEAETMHRTFYLTAMELLGKGETQTAPTAKTGCLRCHGAPGMQGYCGCVLY